MGAPDDRWDERACAADEAAEAALQIAVDAAYHDPDSLFSALWFCEPSLAPTTEQRIAHNALKAALYHAAHCRVDEGAQHFGMFIHSAAFRDALTKVVERRAERRGDDGCYDAEDYA